MLLFTKKMQLNSNMVYLYINNNVKINNIPKKNLFSKNLKFL